MNLSRRQFVATGSVGLAAGAVGMEGCNPNAWLALALNDLPVIIQIITSILSIVSAATGSSTAAAVALANTAAGKAKDAINEAIAFLKQYQANKTNTLLGNVDDALTTAQSQLGAILSILGINNPVLQATLAAAIGSALTIIVAVQTLVPAPVQPTVRTLQAQRRVELSKVTATDQSIAIKVGFNEAVTAAGGPQFSI